MRAWDLIFFFCLPSHTPSLSVLSESIPLYKANGFDFLLKFTITHMQSHTHMKHSTMALHGQTSYCGRLVHSSQVINTTSAPSGEWVTVDEATGFHTRPWHLSSLLYLICAVPFPPSLACSPCSVLFARLTGCCDVDNSVFEERLNVCVYGRWFVCVLPIPIHRSWRVKGH